MPIVHYIHSIILISTKAQAMIQTLVSPCFSPRLHHGFPTWIQLPRRQIHNHGRYKENIYSITCGNKVSTSKDTFGGSYRYKSVREHKALTLAFCAQSENDEFILQPKNDHIFTPQSKFWRKVDVFYRFCRLHTIVGTIIAVSSVSLLSVTSLSDLSPVFFTGLLKALIPVALMNTYVSCVNQVTDVEIDKVNKPHFVLVAGEYTMGQGKAIAVALALMCLVMGIMFKSPPVFVGLLVHFLLGTAYSVELPLLRWKKNPFLSAFCIVSVIGLLIPSVAFIHIQKYVLGRPLVFTRPFGFTIFTFTLFSIVFSLAKDLPDVEGDGAFGIQTFSIMYGKRKVFGVCKSIMLTVYGSAMLIGIFSSSLRNKLITVLGHCALGIIFWTRAQSLNLDDNSAAESFYQFLWKLLYAEYLLIHFIQ